MITPGMLISPEDGSVAAWQDIVLHDDGTASRPNQRTYSRRISRPVLVIGVVKCEDINAVLVWSTDHQGLVWTWDTYFAEA